MKYKLKRYDIRTGVHKTKTRLAVALTSVGLLAGGGGLSMAIFGTAHAANSIVVISGDTSAAENDPGWMFNRDLSTATPFEFNQNQASIGLGSLFVEPIGTNASDKFVAENFVHMPVTDLNSIAYDFLIAGNGTPTSANQFYLNVYANTVNDNKFYDCRFDYVPSSGSTSGFTTFAVNSSSVPANVQQSGTARTTCPTTLSGMPTGSYIRMFSLSVGDTTTSDQGLAGYLDRVVVNNASDTTTYNLDPYHVHSKIQKPNTNQHVLGDTLHLKAKYVDGDNANDDAVQWAVRAGTCPASTNTVFGNVDGHNDTFNWNGKKFNASIDISSTPAGQYCFVFNPTDDPGQNNVRETRLFYIGPNDKSDCKNGGWQALGFNNQGRCVAFVNRHHHHHHHQSNNVSIFNGNYQNAHSGNVNNSYNTNSGNVHSGNATNNNNTNTWVGQF